MRIAMVTEVWAPTVNGVVTRLAATVADLLSRGHQVLVICPAVTGTATAPNQLPEGLAVRTVPTVSVPFVYGGQAWGWPAPRVTRYLREFAPDVVHVANPISLGVAGVRAAGHLHRPLVCSYHTDVASYARHYHLGWLRPVIRRHLRQLHAHAALNLVTSAAGRDQLETIVGPGPESVRPPVALWPRGVDLSRFSPACRTPGGASHHVLYVGRLADEKGIATLATLAADPGFHLTVVGDGPARHTLERQLPSGTRFTGTLGGTELADAYRAADLFAFPSVTDTLGLVLLEAMASGLPVLAADSPASRELLGRSPAARLWQPGQEGELPRLAHELLATGTPDQLAARARAEVSGRDWHAATAALLDHYERVAALIPAAGSTPRATSRPTGRRFWSRPAPG